jgi:hypothetical protein
LLLVDEGVYLQQITIAALIDFIFVQISAEQCCVLALLIGKTVQAFGRKIPLPLPDHLLKMC